MTLVFISHSSHDSDFVKQLDIDLREIGFDTWVDHRNITVGDSIPSQMSDGLERADYIVIVLSTNAIQSGWFTEEWEAKYWQGVNEKRKTVLPVLRDDCDIPFLLKPKRYADCRSSYAKGLLDLVNGNSAVLPTKRVLATTPASTRYQPVTELLSQSQDRQNSLTKCLTDGISVAHAINDAPLEQFCRQELQGWETVSPPAPAPKYRLAEVFVSMNELNLHSWHWAGGTHRIFAFMRSSPDEFWPMQVFVRESVPYLEAHKLPDSNRALVMRQGRCGDTMPEVAKECHDLPIWFYMRVDAFQEILEAIRQELCQMLLNLMPRLEPPV